MHRRVPGIAMVLDINGKLALKKATHLGLAERAGWRKRQAYSICLSPAQTCENVASGRSVAASRRLQNERKFNGFQQTPDASD
jgi:hypothetical protein